MTRAELARRVGITPQAVSKYAVAYEDFPEVQVGRFYRYPEAAVRFIRARQAEQRERISSGLFGANDWQRDL
jgi:hypothetical protein